MNILTKIANASYNELGKMLTKGEVSIKQLQRFYTSQRRIAVDRYRKINVGTVREEYGYTGKEYFSPLKNLVTTSDLLHAIIDVKKFLTGGGSTKTELRQRKEKYVEKAKQNNLPVNNNNYNKWIRFIDWFSNSIYAKYFDSESEEIAEIFEEGNSPTDWERLILELEEYEY